MNTNTKMATPVCGTAASSACTALSPESLVGAHAMANCVSPKNATSNPTWTTVATFTTRGLEKQAATGARSIGAHGTRGL
eukprot:CAMPEP_0198509588 /NCGR_PEP_ID=MMETSP1462-20131121/13657_1 /TAXON_ID=1333877 /ORGANISM="Brandtodinium nutriculum, Strain RCC3387" /LENGTH=79 /DNA_ID=CAMNT_0044238897 /DNA_START=40 /DNA_END=275 /DNA_ORIENTATION=-